MLLAARSNDQRQQIKAAFKKASGKVRRAARDWNTELMPSKGLWHLVWSRPWVCILVWTKITGVKGETDLNYWGRNRMFSVFTSNDVVFERWGRLCAFELVWRAEPDVGTMMEMMRFHSSSPFKWKNYHLLKWPSTNQSMLTLDNMSHRILPESQSETRTNKKKGKQHMNLCSDSQTAGPCIVWQTFFKKGVNYV